MFRVYSRSGERIFSRGWSPAVTGRGGRERAVEGGGGHDGWRRGPIGGGQGRNGPSSARFGAKIPRNGGDDAFFSLFESSASLKTAFCISGPGRSGVVRQNFRRFRLPQGRSCVLRPPIEPSAAEGGVDALTQRPASVSGLKTVANRPKKGHERDSRFFSSVNSHEK